MNPLPAIPDNGLLLHIGPPKTGSTAIQNAFHANRDGLAAAGVHYAGPDSRPREAGWAVLGDRRPVGRPAPRIAKWERLVEEIHAHEGQRICLSSEDFAKADDAAVERILSALGAERVHLVHVVRRFDRLLPSLWQERVKARQTRTFEDWLSLVLADEGDTFEYRNLWHPHDVSGILERWGRLVPAERVTLICSDGDDRELIPRSFEQLLGLPTGLLDPDPMRANRGLTANEAELLRRLNEVARKEKWTGREYLNIAQRGVAGGFRRATPSPNDVRIPAPPAWAYERIAEFSARQAAAVRTSGAQVAGDPDRLLVGEAPGSAVPEPVTTVDIDTAVIALTGAIAEARKVGRKAGRRAGRKAGDRARRADGGARRRKPAATRPAVELSSRQLLGIVLRRATGRANRR